MSRLSKYLNQKAEYHKANGLDLYGEPQFHQAVEVSCRRERIVKDIKTTDGSLIKSFCTYYTDENAFLNVGDKLDGQSIIAVEDYIGSLGELEGSVSYV